ncbi:HAMP domain-containing sensor histidine kinase [Lentzea sp. NPDC051208]|uniref:HAMP domain-containing sensor histidine kinase n=1 Tax=Lentzea sp. NPDC051208 TaxID=3154642 RepID=UPI003446CEA3
MKREMTRSLMFAASTVGVALLVAAAVLLVRTRACAAEMSDSQDVATISAVVAVTAEPDQVRSAVARTRAGREGRIAVHLASGGTIGSGKAARAEVSVAAAGGPVPASWRVLPGRAVVELSEPASIVDTWVLPELVVLALMGFLATVVAVVAGRRRCAPLVQDLCSLADTARDGRIRVRATGSGELADLVAALNEAADRVERARAGEREMIADVSHRLRTPLTALRLDVEALGDGVLARRIRGAVAALDRDVDRIIESLQPAEPRLVPCDLGAVVRARMGFWAQLAADQHRWCDVNVPDRPMSVEIAADVLGAAVDTVLDNVFQHTPSGTPLAVEVSAHAGWITLVVDDGGPGVSAPAEAVLRRSSGGGSTGLGLAIARAAAETTGGSLHVERGRLNGARVRMRFGEAGRTWRGSEPRAWRLWQGAR